MGALTQNSWVGVWLQNIKTYLCLERNQRKFILFIVTLMVKYQKAIKWLTLKEFYKYAQGALSKSKLAPC